MSCSEQLENNDPNFDPRALKDDGNAQYRLKNYFGAHVTYTLAIGLVRREDEGSQRLLAILYSNCAACSLAVNELVFRFFEFESSADVLCTVGTLGRLRMRGR